MKKANVILAAAFAMTTALSAQTHLGVNANSMVRITCTNVNNSNNNYTSTNTYVTNIDGTLTYTTTNHYPIPAGKKLVVTDIEYNFNIPNSTAAAQAGIAWCSNTGEEYWPNQSHMSPIINLYTNPYAPSFNIGTYHEHFTAGLVFTGGFLIKSNWSMPSSASKMCGVTILGYFTTN